MRLTCPNCGAQYEVNALAIPDGGREVQCSGCGHNWFQLGTAAPQLSTAKADTRSTTDENGVTRSAAAVPPARIPTPEVSEDHPTAKPADDISRVLATMMEAGPDSLSSSAPDDYLEDSDYDDTLAPAPAVGAMPRKPVDESMLAILREEAEREAAHRRAEGVSDLQSQPDLGLDEAPHPAPQDKGRTLFDQDDGAEEANGQKRPERLPDVEEINSTLASAADRSATPASASASKGRTQKGGFRRGFVAITLIAALGLATYAFAPRLIGIAPKLEAPLTKYVMMIDTARINLDQKTQAILEKYSENGWQSADKLLELLKKTP